MSVPVAGGPVRSVAAGSDPAVSPDGRMLAYVTGAEPHRGPEAIVVRNLATGSQRRWAFTSDTQKPRLAVISTKANKVERWVDLPGTGYGTQSTPEGKWLLVALPGANAVGVIDLATFRVARTINVPASPQEVLVDPDGKVAYVSCSASGKVAAIKIADWSVKPIEAGHGADGLAWAK